MVFLVFKKQWRVPKNGDINVVEKSLTVWTANDSLAPEETWNTFEWMMLA